MIQDADPIWHGGVVGTLAGSVVLGVAFGPAAAHYVAADVISPVSTTWPPSPTRSWPARRGRPRPSCPRCRTRRWRAGLTNQTPRPLSAAELTARFNRSAWWAREMVAAGRERLAAATAPTAYRRGGSAGLPSALPVVPVGAALLPIVPPPAVGTAELVLPPAAVPAVVEAPALSVAEPAEGGRPTGRAAASVAFLFGVLATVAGNVAHAAQVPHAGAGPFLAASVWPLMLLAAVEVLVRVRPPAGVWWWTMRFVGTVTVAGVAAVVSYELLVAYGGRAGVGRDRAALADALATLADVSLLAASPPEGRQLMMPPELDQIRRLTALLPPTRDQRRVWLARKLAGAEPGWRGTWPGGVGDRATLHTIDGHRTASCAPAPVRP